MIDDRDEAHSENQFYYNILRESKNVSHRGINAVTIFAIITILTAAAMLVFWK